MCPREIGGVRRRRCPGSDLWLREGEGAREEDSVEEERRISPVTTWDSYTSSFFLSHPIRNSERAPPSPLLDDTQERERERERIGRTLEMVINPEYVEGRPAKFETLEGGQALFPFQTFGRLHAYSLPSSACRNLSSHRSLVVDLADLADGQLEVDVHRAGHCKGGRRN